MKAGVALVISLLAGCNQVGVDGYAFGDPEYTKTHLTVDLVLVDTEAELRALGPGEDGRKVMAFANLNPAHNQCTIYTVKPSRTYQPQWLGHELTHCIHGRWHQ